METKELEKDFLTMVEALISFYISELGFNPCYHFEVSRVLIVIGLTLITFAVGLSIGIWQIRRHTQQLQEIERGLKELREFEK